MVEENRGEYADPLGRRVIAGEGDASRGAGWRREGLLPATMPGSEEAL